MKQGSVQFARIEDSITSKIVKKAHYFSFVEYVNITAHIGQILEKCHLSLVKMSFYLIVTGRPCDSVAQWSECSHGMREVRIWQNIRTSCSRSKRARGY